MKRLTQILSIILIVSSGFLIFVALPKNFFLLAGIVWLFIVYKSLKDIPFWCITTLLGFVIAFGNTFGLYMKTKSDVTLKGYDYLFTWIVNDVSWLVKEFDQGFLQLSIVGFVVRVLLMAFYGLIIDVMLHCRVLFLKFDLYVNDTRFCSKTPFKVTAKTYHSLKTALPEQKITLNFDVKSRKAMIQTVKVELIDFDVEVDGTIKLYTFEKKT